ncbi:hypothetical protein P5V15_007864 [Pogonomyrmex californicus]
MCGKLCFLLFAICLAKNATLGNPTHCHRDPYLYTGTKTPYSYVHNNTGESMAVANCMPMQIWMLCRHGTRYPDELTIARILNLTQIRDRVMANKSETQNTRQCERKDLKNWKPHSELVPEKGKHLAMQGEKDLMSLAERLKAKLPMLFDENVIKKFKFRSTGTQRTIASMSFFMKGAFGNRSEIESLNNISLQFESMNMQQTATYFLEDVSNDTSIIELEVVPTANDTLLKMYDSCESWKNVGVNKEVDAFINGAEMARIFANVSRRLDLANISKGKLLNNINFQLVTQHPLSFTTHQLFIQIKSIVNCKLLIMASEDAFLFYDACRFERAWNPDESSPWCDVFTNNEMQVFEYEEDLFYYYRSGPGEKINGELGCHPIRDMFDHFTKLESVKDGDEPRGVFYFTHSHMIGMFLTAMGVGKDSVPLTTANFRDMYRRNWRSSLLMPFTANFAAVFHRCDSNDTPFKVAFYLNENPLTLEDCENGVCDWIQLKEKLGGIAVNCSMEVCQKKS